MGILKSFAQGFLGLIFALIFFYVSWWVVKSISYGLFYQSMVRDTITEMVRPEALKRP
jgi:uncharacterized membrane protein YwzB